MTTIQAKANKILKFLINSTYANNNDLTKIHNHFRIREETYLNIKKITYVSYCHEFTTMKQKTMNQAYMEAILNTKKVIFVFIGSSQAIGIDKNIRIFLTN